MINLVLYAAATVVGSAVTVHAASRGWWAVPIGRTRFRRAHLPVGGLAALVTYAMGVEPALPVSLAFAVSAICAGIASTPGR